MSTQGRGASNLVRMHLSCPSCGAKITPLKVKPQFACPECSAPLKGSFSGPLIATLIAWIAADFFIYVFVTSLVGTGYLGTAIRILLSAGVGFVIYAILFSRFACVSPANERKAL